MSNWGRGLRENGEGSMTASPQEGQGEWGPSISKAPLQELLYVMLRTRLQEWKLQRHHQNQ